MISSLSRNLPRTTAAAASARIQPASSIVPSTRLRRPPPPPRPAFFLPRASFVSGSSGGPSGGGDSSDDDDEGKDSTTALRGDAIADIIAAEHGLKISVSRNIVATVFDTIVESVTKKQTVAIAGFGKFAPLEVPARDYTNPQDARGPKISKPPTTRVKFAPSKHFRDCVAGVDAVEKKKKKGGGDADDVVSSPPME